MVIASRFKADPARLGQAAQDFNEPIVIRGRISHPESLGVAIYGLNHYHIKILGNIYCHP